MTDGPLPSETITLPVRGWQITPSHALAAACACWAGFAIVAWGVHSDGLAGFDAAGLQYWRGTSMPSPGLLEAVRDVTALGGVVLRIAISLAAVVALVFLGLRREAVLLVATLLSGLAVNSTIKLLVGRPRPQIVPHLTEAGGMSFPSGHSFNSALGMIAVALAFATLSSRRSVRWTIIGAAMAVSMAVAWSRVWLGVHYPTDAIAGWLGGAGWAFMAAAVLYRPAKQVAEARAAAR